MFSRDTLEDITLLLKKDEVLDNVTFGLVKEDNIECCVCLNYHWGVKLPNCNHLTCPTCYYIIYEGYISNEFYSKNHQPKFIEEPLYPYRDKNKNKEIFYSITQDETYLEWFVDDNEDLYKSIKMNTEFVVDLDIELKSWFENNEVIKQYKRDLKQYRKNRVLENFYADSEKYYESRYQERERNTQKKCPLCRA